MNVAKKISGVVIFNGAVLGILREKRLSGISCYNFWLWHLYFDIFYPTRWRDDDSDRDVRNFRDVPSLVWTERRDQRLRVGGRGYSVTEETFVTTLKQRKPRGARSTAS